MLCPKCGYITFDELPSCPKCKKKWDDIPGKIIGLVGMTEVPNFLSGILKGKGEDDSVVGTPEPVNEEAEKEELVFEGSGITGNEIEDENISFSGESDVAIVDIGGLDLVLDDLPDTEIATSEVEIPELNLALSSDDGEVDVEGAAIALELDGDISKESSEASPPPALAIDATDEAGDKLTVDLHDIDLSDLMEPGITREEHLETSGREDDLDQPILDISSPSVDQGVPDLLGIDLSLEQDDDSLDLSLESEENISDSAKKKDEIAIPDLGLSLDLDE